MQQVSEIMTRNVRAVSPQGSLQVAAQLMDELNVGALPVCQGERLVGMVTDRDITVRGTAAGKSPQEGHVEDVMSTNVRYCFDDQSVDDVMGQMGETQIRRVPVVSHDEQRKLIGIVPLGDLATKASGDGQQKEMVRTVGQISTPSTPNNAPRKMQQGFDVASDDSARVNMDADPDLYTAATTTGTTGGGADSSGIAASRPGTSTGSAAGAGVTGVTGVPGAINASSSIDNTDVSAIGRADEARNAGMPRGSETGSGRPSGKSAGKKR